MNNVVVYQEQVGAAKKILHFIYVFVPFVAGLDKFFEYLVDWNRYLAPEIPRMFGIDGGMFMLWVGVIEIIVALITAITPRVGGKIVAIWLWLIIINLFMIPGFYDIILRDFGLSLGALALVKLSNKLILK